MRKIKYCMICQTLGHNAKDCPTCKAKRKASINKDWELANCVPDLLAALEALVEKAELMAGAGAPTDCIEAISQARAAIAKAKGVTP